MLQITKKDISLHEKGNRLIVDLGDGKVAQYVFWDLESSQLEFLQLQIMTGFNICNNFDEIDKHLKINGLNAHLEDIY